MTTCATLLADLNDLLSDTSNTKYTEAMKIRYLNRGQRAMYPKVHVVSRDATLVLIADTFEYAVPVGLNEGRIMGIEVETSASSSRFVQLDGRQFDYQPGGTGQKTLILKGSALPSAVGASLRITAALPLTDFVTSASTYSGPSVTEELPVLYAMGMATARDIEARLHYQRFSTTQGLNGTDIEDFQVSATYWFDQFHRLLDQVAMPVSTP